MNKLKIERIRRDFPALKEWTYLDNSFVGLMPRQVKEGYDRYIDLWYKFKPKNKQTILSNWLEKLQNVRKKTAKFIGVSSDEIAFTTCTGSGLNIVINGIKWSKGDNVVFPSWEHNPLDTYTLRKNGVESRACPVRNGKVEIPDLEEKVDDRTKIIQVSEIGCINGFRFDLKKVSDLAHEHGAKVLVDATQSIGAIKVDYKRDQVDYVSAAPYKYLMGPSGLAFLYIKKENLMDLTPDRIGWKNQLWEGDHAEDPSNLETAEKFEYGTLHFQGVYALEKSLEYLEKIGINKVEKRNLQLQNYAWKKAKEIGKDLYTPKDTKSTIVSFYQNDPNSIATKLMERKIKVTGREAHGSHIRVSVHFYNTTEEIDHLFSQKELKSPSN